MALARSQGLVPLVRLSGFASCRLFSKDATQPTKPQSSAPALISEDDIPEITIPAQGFKGDLRSTSGLGLGDGIKNHTDKWLQPDAPGNEGTTKWPMQYILEAEPIKVHGLVYASRGTEDPALGCPVEYIDMRGTTRENPAVCKYTGNKYYSDSWKGGGSH